MDTIKEISNLIQVGLNELGSIIVVLIGVLGIIKLLKDQVKQLFGK